MSYHIKFGAKIHLETNIICSTCVSAAPRALFRSYNTFAKTLSHICNAFYSLYTRTGINANLKHKTQILNQFLSRGVCCAVNNIYYNYNKSSYNCIVYVATFHIYLPTLYTIYI